ncbi:DUF3329 domain-containing protein [Oricola thermophila]|uniref:DUF3329 domain-containing protein n=2 Tax=Oricola thermophila TaxID=2742145 RepID=A0A6N1VL95_9HYPH|nr:DUF3329 domain-containing protein [Oricola thermophila]
MFDFNNPFYRPLWKRVAVVALPGTWGAFEFVAGSPFWGVLFCGAAALAFHGLFIAFEPRDTDVDSKDEE